MDSQEDWMSDERAAEEPEVDLLEPDECEPESVYVTLHRYDRPLLFSLFLFNFFFFPLIRVIIS